MFEADTLADGYYLVGKLNGVTHMTVDTLTADMMLTENEFAKGEYTIEWTFYDGDAIKVAKVESGAITTWYKDGMDNEYKITTEGGKTGEGTLAFRPEGNAEWSYFYLTVTPKVVNYTVTFANVTGGAVYDKAEDGEKVPSISVAKGTAVAVDGNKITIGDKDYYAIADSGYEFKGFGTVAATITAATTITPVLAEADYSPYCLCGYINDADYGMTEMSTPKWNEPGEYIFSKDGTLTAMFEKDSYVQVKTLHGEYWYAFEKFVNDGTTTVMHEASDTYKEPMFVPANTMVKFTLSKTAQGDFQLGYEEVSPS